MATEPVRLGQRYRDALTDYAGVAIARCEYLHDAPDVKLQRLDTYGKPEEFWFDEARLVLEARVPATQTAGFGPTTKCEDRFCGACGKYRAVDDEGLCLECGART